MSLDDVISDVIKREGGKKATSDPTDRGGRTQYGISEKANPAAWADGQVTEDEARKIYLQKYVVNQNLHTIPPSHKHTQAMLIDWGVHIGPAIAITALQKIVNVEADGVFGKQTLQALLGVDDRSLTNLLVAARLRMVARVVQRNPTQVKFLAGWLDRVISFIS